MIIDEEDYLAHYGILRRSGRYPWGSGGPERVSTNPNKRNKQFLDYVNELREQGLSDVEIARGLNATTTELRAARTIARNEQKQSQIAFAQKLKDKGYSNVAIGERMNLNESSVRALLAPGEKEKNEVLNSVSTMLKDEVANKRFIDIGSGVENHVGVSSTKLGAAVAMLREEGYQVMYLNVPQVGTGKNTKLKILAPPDATYSELIRNQDKIQQIAKSSDDGGKTYFAPEPPLSISPSRVSIRYKEDGGADADGVIYVRPGVKDISLGNASYAQVRIKVGDGHYLKGMAMYKDDLPEGTDLLFNTNKSDTGNKLDAMKPLKDDPDNPFGANISKQVFETDARGNKKVSSVMNIVNEEGDWAKWSKSISSQVLSKQNRSLAKAQLDQTYQSRLKDFQEIQSLTNPVVKRKLLQSFSDDVDAAAVHLKAAALPRQASHVILPIESIPESQVYAPRYRNGESVALIRFPHGGTFEIPIVTVNNNHPESVKLLGSAKDAIGIHPKVAERLSGADFDGDTVLVIPNNSGRIKNSPPLEGLKDFDPKTEYKGYPGMPKITPTAKQTQMGFVSNLITDMTIKGASNSEIARAVRHSMVVIDAEKHNLDYRRSAVENGIPALRAKYQNSSRGGASTLISISGQNSKVTIPDRRLRRSSEGGPIDLETGKLVYEPTGETYVNKNGKLTTKVVRVPRLSIIDDANTVSSGTPIERIYAEHSNRLKKLGNDARLEMVKTPPLVYSPSANKVYAREVQSLNAKLNVALRNRPLERQAQLIANTIIRAKRQAYPDMDDTTLKKEKAKALNTARVRTGAKKVDIIIEPREWEAIQAGAITNKRLKDIIDNADIDTVRKLATPRTQILMSPTNRARAIQLLNSGATRAEVADRLGVSVSTLDRSLVEGGE